MKEKSFSFLFFIKKTRLNKSDEAPISFRITMNGQRAESTIQRNIDPKKWNNKKEKAMGTDRDSQELNLYLETVRSRIYSIYRELESDNRPITSEILKQLYLGTGEGPKMLLVEFNKHNKKCRELLYKDYALGTVLRFERTVTYLSEYLQKEYKLKDIPFKEVNHEFIKGFEHYVKVTKECSQNTTVKYVSNLKKIIRFALSSGWILTDPFMNIRLHNKRTNREFLQEEEVGRLMEKEFNIERLEVVRDVFVFCCFTGLAFIDVQHLKPDDITKDNKGEIWIRKARKKTDNMSSIPLLEIPRQIIDKYRSHPECLKKNVLLPVPSNQKMNSYLKEIADLCGIKMKLSTHIARHTFACMAIANKISIETIAKMLGHADIRTTRQYAKIVDKTISEEMNFLRRKFD